MTLLFFHGLQVHLTLTSCDFFLRGYVKDHVLVPPMPLDLADLRQRIENAVAGNGHQILVRVWQELDYRIDVCQVTNGGIWNTCKVCTETLRDTVSSGTKLFSMSAMVADLQTHETPVGLLICPVLLKE